MYNVFLTKMSAFLPASKYRGSPPGLQPGSMGRQPSTIFIEKYEHPVRAAPSSMILRPGILWRTTAIVTRILCWRLNTRFRVAALAHRFRQQSIHLREKNIAGPTERSSKGGTPPLLIARREGPAFFDEDDVCCRILEAGSSLSDPGNWHTLR